MMSWKPIPLEHAGELSLGARDGGIVGDLDAALLDGRRWPSIWVAVAADARRQGVGSSALRFATELADSTVVLRGAGDAGNSASLGLVRAAGFAVAAQADEDGLIEEHRP